MNEQEPTPQLLLWINAVNEYNDCLKIISQQVDKATSEYKKIVGGEDTGDALIELLFMRNRLENMLKLWLGEDVEDD